MRQLRGVMSLFPETVTVLVRSDAGIEKLADVLGKRIDIGHPASGRRATVDRLLGVSGLSAEDFSEQLELPVGTAIDELCDGRIDVTVLVSGHPSDVIARALRDCAVMVPVRGPRIDPALQASTDFVPARIPAAAYPELEVDVPSYAVMATLVTRSDMPEEIVEALVSDNLENLAVLARKAPILADLDPDEMPTRGMTAPLHPGAEAAYRKSGISPEHGKGN
jgi:TRAP transporter TAXI family solute receptor